MQVRKGELALQYGVAPTSPELCSLDYISPCRSYYCVTEGLKRKLRRPSWKRGLFVLSPNLNDTDHSCFVKLEDKVITWLQAAAL